METSVCPGCGRCNTCGRGPTPAPAPPPMPWTPWIPYGPCDPLPNTSPGLPTPIWIQPFTTCGQIGSSDPDFSIMVYNFYS